MKKDKIYVIMVTSLIIDQFIKFIVRANINLLETIKVIPSFFSITYLENKGAAWGILGNSTFFLIIISFIAFLVLINFIKKESNINKIQVLSFGLILGGLVGNLIDRLLYGSVTDYLDFTIFNYNFPVFNFADITIVIGVMILLFDIVRSEIYASRSK